MKSLRPSSIILSAVVLLSLLLTVGSRSALAHTNYDRVFVFDGVERTYTVHLPVGYTGLTPVPLVLDFHGFGSSVFVQQFISGMEAVSDAEGFIVAYPEGLDASWNGGLCCGESVAQNVDDVGFAHAVIAAVVAEENIDVQRVYATGLSNGGAMTHRLGCEAANTFAAVAPLAFPLPFSPLSVCVPSRAIPVLHFAGTDDTLVPYGGNVDPFLASAAASFAYWRDTNGCGAGLPDETVVTGASMCETYTSCTDGVEVGLCSIDADDTPPDPGHILYFNQDLVLAEVAWDFLSQFTAPPPVCGDGVLGAGEACDDGNTDNFDGCSATCQIEQPPCVGDKACKKCERTILKESAKLAQGRAKILAKCELAKVKGKHSDPCPDAKAAEKLAKASTKFAAQLGKQCGGGDKVCNGVGSGGVAEIAPDALLWPGTCPNFEGSLDPACSATVTDCSGILDCLECINDTAVDQAVGLYFDDLTASTPGSELNKCQQAIGKEAQKFLNTKSKILQKCWDSRVKGKHEDVCPDATAADGTAARKAADAIAKAEGKKIAKICKSCGGAGKACQTAIGSVAGDGLADDLAPSAIYNAVFSCDAVQVPGGQDCGAIGLVDTLEKLVECVDCVTEFKVDCMDRAQVPGFTAYPAECNP